ncbi:3'-5' exonuclease, partial [Chloroflexota bacterium]
SNIISVNQQRKPKNLWTQNKPGEPATIVETYTEQEEAQFVVSEVERLVKNGEFSLGDCAVMYRTNAQSRALEEAFIRYGTPYKLVAGTRFYERREVKDIIAYLRFIQNPNDSVSLMRIINVPQRGVGQQTQAKLSNWAKSTGVSQYEALQLVAKTETTKATPQLPFNTHTYRILAGFLTLMQELITRSKELKLVDLFDLVVERSGYRQYILDEVDGEERWENILELRTVAQDYANLKPSESLTTFLEGVTLVSDVDGLDESVSVATLITLHQAKGLEFPVVFIVGMEDGILPHFRSFDDPEQMEEERRLCYVGVTRAKQKVYLVRAFRRNLMGRSVVSQPSRFLSDIPQHLISTGDWQEGGESQIIPSIYSWNKPPTPSSPTLGLKPGDHVHHVQFGNGVIVSYQPVKDDAEVVVAFNGTIRKLLLSYANLEKLE